MRYMDIEDHWTRAVMAEDGLRAVAYVTFAARVDDRMVIKKMINSLCGWNRGQIPVSCPEEVPEHGDLVPFSEVREPEYAPANTDIERWLRSRECWDSVMSHLLRQSTTDTDKPV